MTPESTPAVQLPADARLAAEAVTLGYAQRTISDNLTVRIPDGSFTVIVGPNACGKSTLLRGLSNLLSPAAGQILLDGKKIAGYPSKQLARELGLLPQSSIAPSGITVADLVARGRYPYQNLVRQWSKADATAVAEALAATNTTSLSTRLVEELSGGQRQRVWVAMALAQQTSVLLLDEPTTFLDIAHQIELLELFRALNQDGRTLVAVLHDLNHAARYATHIIAMKDGQVMAEGHPREIITAELVERVFDLPNVVIEDPVTGSPLVIPLGTAAP
ncbi:iron-dicitrate transporter ATP-binding subunit [Arthrobacter alpinus]|uniref:ABC transporter ATP-binding protein n=1 Tax=Arthrobacter alpinus TaxID=656366 RepID=UPI0005C95D4B|nr:ABC transporter ATP-binding protein [Arthrobacter alpinus]ALV47584.1 iron-dicitrate transporter ATP-binding subunit [Arthrobacter alpinus]